MGGERGRRGEKAGTQQAAAERGRGGGRPKAAEAGLGLCPASRALLYLLRFDPQTTLCPVGGHSVGPWGPPVSPASTRVQSTQLKPQAVPKSPWGIKETLGLSITTDGREVSKEQAHRMQGAAAAGEGPAAPGLPRRDADWHETDAAAQLALLSKLPHWSTGLLFPK